MIEEIFKRMCESRYFELGLIKAHKEGLISCPIYLSLGQESIAASLSVLCPEYRVFAQHRGNSWYLAFGGSPEALRDEYLGRITGCSGGKGGSDVGSDKLEAHHGLLGETPAIAVGYSLATQHPVIVVVGDGSVEEEGFLTSVGFASTHKLPVLFVSEDNGLAILTPIKDRRSWDITSVVRSFGLYSVDTTDDPENIADTHIVLPMFLNIRTTRHYWHVGSGQDETPEIDRVAQYRNIKNGERIEKEAKELMEDVWRL